jgi:RimJ/RimL family protein N-acetyltransferase
MILQTVLNSTKTPANTNFHKSFKSLYDFCFESYGFNKLFLRTHDSNYSARKVAENCGFEMEGTIRRDYKTTAGDFVDLLYYLKIAPTRHFC